MAHRNSQETNQYLDCSSKGMYKVGDLVVYDGLASGLLSFFPIPRFDTWHRLSDIKNTNLNYNYEILKLSILITNVRMRQIFVLLKVVSGGEHLYSSYFLKILNKLK